VLELFGHDDDTPTAREPAGGAAAPGTGESPTARTGDLLFYPALPTRWPRLELDIINCHHPDYYGGQKGDVSSRPKPVDYESPVPVFFLAVAAGTPFAFRLGSRAARAGDPSGRAHVALAFELLAFGLEWLGAGSKTAVGYGRMQAK
jgi:CRISPR-associated protein Cmr6